MKSRSLTLISLVVLAAVMAWLAIPAQASQPQQVAYETPTAQPDGRIIYTVQAGDNCLSISLLTGVDINTLIQLNDLDEDCTLLDGQQLLLGLYQEPTPTAGPSPTATLNVPSPTPEPGFGAICIMLFNDINGNALLEDGELPIAGGAISVTDRSGNSLFGETIQEYDADEEEYLPKCFEDLPEGDYNISVGIPDGYNPTTSLNYPLQLLAGDTSVLDFGAQESSSALPTDEPGGSSGGRSPLLAILGGILILIGIGMALYFRTLTRR
ncbi:MAG: LysM peptidoglycan-binding domain-containing protein [Anaerolineae bacterium]|nr:LysM peptidoglycan-binding domain-containing protein [Anaerolineae bacterium]